jgi:predicted LPLAT superfamily acyltransferase
MDESMRSTEQWQARPEAGGRFGKWLLRTLAFRVGRSFARVITYPVAFYFMVRRAPERAAARTYLHRALGREPGLRDVYRHFLCFSQVTLDRLYLMADQYSRFDVRILGIEKLHGALRAGNGALLLSAHLGSFDVLRVLHTRNPLKVPIRILLDVGQNAGLSHMLNALNPGLASTIIDARRTGPELVLEMQAALAKNSVVSTLADRMRPGNSPVVANFFGAPAAFPASPWLFAGALRVPVVIAFGLYRGGNRYDLHFEEFPCDLPRDRAVRRAALSDIVQRFADRLAHFARLAPYNWFNLYDFWNPPANPDPDASDATPGRAADVRAGDGGPSQSGD